MSIRNPEIETMSREELKKLQSQRLVEQVKERMKELSVSVYVWMKRA